MSKVRSPNPFFWVLVACWAGLSVYMAACATTQDPFGPAPNIMNGITLEVSNRTGYYLTIYADHDYGRKRLGSVNGFTISTFPHIRWPEGEVVQLYFETKDKVCPTKFQKIEPGHTYLVRIERKCFHPKEK